MKDSDTRNPWWGMLPEAAQQAIRRDYDEAGAPLGAHQSGMMAWARTEAPRRFAAESAVLQLENMARAVGYDAAPLLAALPARHDPDGRRRVADDLRGYLAMGYAPERAVELATDPHAAAVEHALRSVGDPGASVEDLAASFYRMSHEGSDKQH